MNISVKTIQSTDTCVCDNYVSNHPDATCYQLSAWHRSIENSYGHKAYYLMATKTTQSIQNPESSNKQPANHQSSIVNRQSSSIEHPASSIQKIVGILPLFHIKHFVFGNALVSLPFCDYGGILADNEQARSILLEEAIKLSHDLHAGTLELHHVNPIDHSNNHNHPNSVINS